jgi:Ran GTPase-activating protein (RanGAP) involved in mRNA processing and transport
MLSIFPIPLLISFFAMFNAATSQKHFSDMPDDVLHAIDSMLSPLDSIAASSTARFGRGIFGRDAKESLMVDRVCGKELSRSIFAQMVEYQSFDVNESDFLTITSADCVDAVLKLIQIHKKIRKRSYRLTFRVFDVDMASRLLFNGFGRIAVALELREQQLSQNQFETLSRLLNEDAAVLWLDLSMSNIQQDWARFSRTLSGSSQLQWLSLANTQLGAADIILFSMYLMNNRSLRWLSLAMNPVKEQGGVVLGQFLATNTFLRYLDLDVTSLADDGVISIVNGLSKNAQSKLEHLSLSSVRLTANSAVALSRFLSGNQSLRYFSISNNDLSDAALSTIVGALNERTSMRRLHLQNNHLGDKTMIALGELLSKCSSLEELNLEVITSSSPVTPAGFKAFSDGLKHTQSLLHLDLTNLNLASGIFYLSDALCHNKSIRSLRLVRTAILTDGMMALSRCIARQPTLTSLDLSFVPLDSNGISALSNALMTNSVLEILNLKRTQIDDAYIPKLASALARHPTLRHLNLSFNDILNNGAVALAKSIQQRSIPIELEITNNGIGNNGLRELRNTVSSGLLLSLSSGFQARIEIPSIISGEDS